MGSTYREYTDRLERELGRHGITTYKFEKRRKHNSLIVEAGGHKYTVVFSSTGSDVFGPARAVSDLRHTLGLVGRSEPIKSVSVRKKAKRARGHLPKFSPPVAKAEPTPVREDRFYGPLAELAARFKAAAAATPATPTSPANDNPDGGGRKVLLLTPFLGHRRRYVTFDNPMAA